MSRQAVTVTRALLDWNFGNGRARFLGVPGKVDAMTDEELADMHRVLAAYHRGRARKAALGVTREYHYDLAQRLADEASQIPRRSAIVERLAEREQHYKPDSAVAAR